MSLYARLLSLSAGPVRTEDVLTEVVAHLWRFDVAARGTREAVVTGWLRSLGVLTTTDSVAAVRIDTQRAYSALLPDEASSRPDMTIEVDRTGERTTVVFVESKVASGEGAGQLNRYARTLDAAHDGGHLVYLTRNHDLKLDDDVLRGVRAEAVAFHRSRWHSVYQAVHDARASAPPELGALYDDLLSFFRHLHMDHEPRFTPTDAVALTRIQQTLRFLEATLWEGDPPPWKRFAGILGGVNDKHAGWRRIREHNRYTIYRKYGDGAPARFEVLLGYGFVTEGFPGLKLEIGALSASAGSTRVADSIRTLDGRPVAGTDWVWKAYSAPEANWAGALVWVPLDGLLGELDHAAAIRRTFGVFLDELAAVVRERPELPWDAPEAEDLS